MNDKPATDVDETPEADIEQTPVADTLDAPEAQVADTSEVVADVAPAADEERAPRRKIDHTPIANGFETVVFDLDGTLVDTAPDLTNALNHVLKQEGLENVDREEVRRLVGRGARVLIERGLNSHKKEASEERLDELLEMFLNYYGRNICRRSRFYPGAKRIMDELLSAGTILAVCTNKPQEMSDELFRRLKTTHRFRAVVGAGSVPAHKPDPIHLHAAIARAGGKPESSVLIGDSEVDVATAKAAGIPVIAVSFGYSETPASELGADAVIDDLGELPAALAALRPAA